LRVQCTGGVNAERDGEWAWCGANGPLDLWSDGCARGFGLTIVAVRPAARWAKGPYLFGKHRAFEAGRKWDVLRFGVRVHILRA
jgi:hypothetical protein